VTHSIPTAQSPALGAHAARVDPAANVGAPSHDRHKARWGVLSWLFGVALVVTVGWVVTHRSEERAFARLVEQARPLWLVAGVLLQLGTYWVEARTWTVMLARAHTPRRMRTLVGLALSKLFMDQALPSGGIGGTLLVVRGLERRGVPPDLGTGAALLELRAYYAGYMIALVSVFWLLWTKHPVSGWIWLPMGVFFAYASLMSWFLAARQRYGILHWLERLSPLRPLAAALATASTTLTKDAALWVRCVLLELAIFLLDALTVWAMLGAVGVHVNPALVFASFMLSSLARTMGIVPGGLGTFEAASVATLGALQVPVAAALAATLLFRGLSFWLPLLPGLIVARRETRQQVSVSKT
jgi:uncharacterized protein (TIRG00374 family)